MSNQQPQQPGWGQQPQQPGWGQQPPAPKKKTGKMIGLGCLGIIVLLVIIGIIAAIASSGGDDETSSPSGTPTVTESSAKTGKAKEPADSGPVVVTAEKATFKKSVLADTDNYTSVQVTIKNNGDEDIDVNPLYFTITDTAGSKHTSELGVDEDQMGTVKLAPGENVTGTITGKGKFDAKYVTYTEGLIGDSVRGDVS
ncbi:DUF4352 domain-containing protein [Streptomyces sp. NBC_00385]|uniref:DUF4352 domain-containing protein n=1 Tax=Streptomyces sp. NBC_00385 TaxID=2975733 RepID=UPI002DDA04DD|nr:DUF4352 domain-containing protein [Streptomyces sp. NBC_00385]WRZ08394.1 DUF4352 domain-containing protein [Streptomyces sp. NBC_00385]